ncbi:MAG: hypothetical protein J6M60_05560 [Clostridia bacterium]|nr:hypothetical protein [Clostridia bacterium]
MENASRAIVMAGSMLMAIIVVSLVVLVFNNFSSFKASEEGLSEAEKTVEFNKQYDVYERNVYGTDLFSLANKIISYNNQEEIKESGYEQMHLKIKLEQDLNDTEKYFKKKNQISADAHDEYYNESEWIANYNFLEDKINKISKIPFESKSVKDEKGNYITKTVKEIANMRTIDKEKLDFKDITIYKGVTYKLDEIVNQYNIYKSDFTKIKETAFKYIVLDDNNHYSKATGRIINMEYYGKFK